MSRLERVLVSGNCVAAVFCSSVAVEAIQARELTRALALLACAAVNLGLAAALCGFWPRKRENS